MVSHLVPSPQSMLHTALRLVAIALVLGMASSPIVTNAQETDSIEETAPIDAEEPNWELANDDAIGSLPTRRLSVDQALALSVKNNLGVEVARYEPLIAEQEWEGAWGAYDPVLSANVGYELRESPNTFVINSADLNQERILNGSGSITGLLPYIGTTLGLEVNTGRTRTNSSIQGFTPQFDSSVFLTANIPLLRGLIWNEPWTQVKVRQLGYRSSIDGFRQSVMDITESTINAYWTLVANREQHGVARKSLETALALLDQTQTQYEVGVVSKVEVVEAEAGVADREFNLIVARNDFENSEDQLVDAVFGRELEATTEFRLEPADDPENYELRDVDVERAVAIAVRNLPELSAANRLIDQREVELKFARNQRLPQFDVDARYGYANVSGEANQRVCGSFPVVAPAFNPTATTQAQCLAALRNGGSFGTSFDDVFTEDGFENYSVRGTLSIPLGNRTARRNVTRGEIELRRAKTQRARTEQDVILNVRSAARGLLASARGIEAAERRRLAAEEQLRAERIRLEHGESTPFEVLQRESDLVDAESQKIGALQSYRAAEARLERAQGTILDTYRIRVEGAEEESYR